MNDQKFKSCHYSLEEDNILFLNEQVSIVGVKSLHPDLIDTCTVIFERNITETTEKTTIRECYHSIIMAILQRNGKRQIFLLFL